MKNLGQYKDLAFFLWKYGNSNLIEQAKLREVAGDEWAEEKKSDDSVTPDQMVKDLKNMGPAFIKLGQLLSTRPDLLPPEYIEALSDLQDEVEPVPYEEIEEVVQEELGVRISKAFTSFEKEPLASASLGQVHLAEIRSGETVVVKVQRPGIRVKIMKELEVLDKSSGFLEENTDFGKRFQVHAMFNHFKKTLLRELDYTKEAEHIKRFQKNLAEFDKITIPSTIDDYCTERVLTMQYLKGKKITNISPLQQLDLDGEEITDQLFKAYLQQIVIDGFIHTDPHPGNVHLMNNDKIAMLDFGMIAHIAPDQKIHYLKLLINIGEGNANGVVDRLIEMSEVMDNADEKTFRNTVGDLVLENRDATAKDLQTGKIILDLVQFAGTNGYLLPIEMSLIGKTLLNLDQVARTLSPDFNPNKAIKKHAMDLTNKHFMQDLTSMNFWSSLLESKELIEKLPERLNKFLSNAAENKLKLKVDAIDEERLMTAFQKVANRITVGLILSALLVGSSLLMQVETEFTMFGYPGLAMIFFLAAIIGSIVLAIDIYITDESTEK